MLKVGLTGNVAAGKSSVLELFRRWGAATIDADLLAREAVAPESAALAEIGRRFGPDMIRRDGTLDRARLRRHVMKNAAEREALNAIIHPEVARLTKEREMLIRKTGAAILVHDVALLFEALDPAAYDAVVLVDAPVDLRRRRLVAARNLPPAEADELIAAQAPSETKRARSTYVIDNDGSLATLEARAGAVWTELQRRAGVV